MTEKGLGSMFAEERFRFPTYTVRTKVFKLFGGSFDVYSPQGDLVLFASQKAFKLKEDIRLYSGKDKSEELLVIKARSILDFSSAYDVEDPTGARYGAFKRKGWKSLAKDEWIVMDKSDNEIGFIREDSAWLAVLRRVMAFLIINLVPQSYHCDLNGMPACTFKQNFNPFVKKIYVDFLEAGAESGAPRARLDKRMGLAAAVLLCAIEGKQSG